MHLTVVTIVLPNLLVLIELSGIWTLPRGNRSIKSDCHQHQTLLACMVTISDDDYFGRFSIDGGFLATKLSMMTISGLVQVSLAPRWTSLAHSSFFLIGGWCFKLMIVAMRISFIDAHCHFSIEL